MRVSTLGRAAGSAAVALAVLSGCSGDDDTPPAPPASTAAGTAAPTAGPGAGGGGGGSPVASPTPGAPNEATSGEPVAVSPLPPAPVGRPVPIQRGLEITVPAVKDTKVTASGPGEIAGPAAVVTVRVANRTAKPYDLGQLAVVASYGAGTPASPTGSGGAKALSGALAPGATTEGTYVFVVPADQARTLRVEVSSGTSAAIVVVQR